ncbi:MAG TPA: diguanylate cyclase [Candidatus Dormibacteraeota bacterium]|jgi:diguanylate cyclase (GGDEF)-like protein|nr:diguanylate cyclase [Candidatus Dormibacteraeota bacterium]
MQARTRVASDRSLTERLARAFAAVSVLIVATLAVTGGCFAVVLQHFEPSVNALIAGRGAIDEVQNGMLDEESGLRGYLDSGNQVFLASYYGGQQEILSGDSATITLATRPDLVGPVLAMRVAQQRWFSEWATPALAIERAVTSPSARQSFLLSGKALFDAYRTASAALSTQVDVDVGAEQTAEHAVVLMALAAAGGMLVLTILVARRQHRGLRAAVVTPVNDLLTTMRKVGAGDLTAQPAGVGPPELREVAFELGQMTTTLAAERSRLAAFESEARSQAARLGLIVNVGREISGSLNLRYVAEAVGKAGLTISGFQTVRMWIINEDRRELNLVHDTNIDHGQTGEHASLQLGEGLVGRAGQFGRTLATLVAGSLATEYRVGSRIAALAVPMIVGARIIGVLELMSEEPVAVDESSLDVLHSLAGQAATAVEAARFHQSADEMSHTDALTHLPNRRRLELDLDLEVARSQRYNRPIACIMLDVDNFKKVNDVHGHQAGDEILSEFGSAFARSLRDSDTAYRYGGEEFCVLLRETDAPAAAIVGERLRVEIANRFAGIGGSAMVTASLGVAAIPSDAIDAKTLIAAADRALYGAKAAGRNCVVRATPTRTVRVSTTRTRSRSPLPSELSLAVVGEEPAAP